MSSSRDNYCYNIGLISNISNARRWNFCRLFHHEKLVSWIGNTKWSYTNLLRWYRVMRSSIRLCFVDYNCVVTNCLLLVHLLIQLLGCSSLPIKRLCFFFPSPTLANIPQHSLLVFQQTLWKATITGSTVASSVF